VTFSKRLRNLAFVSLLAVASALPWEMDRCAAWQEAGSRHEGFLADCDVDPSPWLLPAANSEQRQPVYIGMTPREMALGIAPVDQGRVLLYRSLEVCGEWQAQGIRTALVNQGKLSDEEPLLLEGWPVRDDWGQLTWAFARWRGAEGRWQWLDQGTLPPKSYDLTERAPLLPLCLDPARPEDHRKIFEDVLKRESLYDKPVFGDCIWVDGRDPGRILSAWLAPEDHSGSAAPAASSQSGLVCYVLPRPPRWNGAPLSFHIQCGEREVTWPASISWKEACPAREPPEQGNMAIEAWPPDFSKKLKEDTEILSGEREAVFPKTGKRLLFRRKNNIDPENQLADLVAYLEERYAALGIRTLRQAFVWRGATQTSLLAVIDGEEKEGKPVILADHIDTAFCEDIYAKTGERVSAPGADDNALATAVLLRAAEMAKGARPRLPLWLLHLTGEEFPADDLGARHFVGQLLKSKTDIAGLVLMDLIGFRAADDRVFQINAGESEESLRASERALARARRMTDFSPVLRTRFDERSYLYNTDGLIFSDAGYPVVYFSEHVNKLENIDREGYHHSTDTTAKIDWGYATAIGQVAIETAMDLAEAGRRQPITPNPPSVVRIVAFAGGGLVLILVAGYALRRKFRVRSGGS
jgi:hypothetical protein